MASPLLGRLSEKVQQASAEIVSLKKERERLLAEVRLMEEENRRARRIFREHQELMAERDKVRTRLEQLLQKLESLRV